MGTGGLKNIQVDSVKEFHVNLPFVLGALLFAEKKMQELAI